MPSVCSFTLYVETDAQRTKLENIAQATPGRYGVRVRRSSDAGDSVTDSTTWVGTLETNRIRLADALPASVQLVATDDLAYLKTQLYLDADGDRYEGEDNPLTHVLNALKKGRTQWHYNDFQTLDGVITTNQP